jgi:membrane fusion protein (multidrug efflux system)
VPERDSEEIERLKEEVRRLRDEQQRSKEGPEGAQREPETPPAGRRGFIRSHPIKSVLGLIVIAILVVGAFLFWRYLSTYESTDDAQIDGPVHDISTRVTGVVQAVHVSENQSVKQGELLMELDERDYQVSLQLAEANLAQAEAQIRAEAPAVPIVNTTSQTQISVSRFSIASAEAGIAAAKRDYEAQLSRITQAEANNARAQADLQRYTILVKKDEVSHEEYDQRVAAAKAAASQVESEKSVAAAARQVVDQREAVLSQARSQLNEATENAPRQVSVQRATIDLRRAGVASARAAVEEAKLNLSYTKIFSPVAGVIGRKSVEVGQRVQPGQQLVAIVPLEDIWVTANFKENQLLHMRVGQRATIHVDGLDRDYDGYVDSMPPATAAKFSVLPPENASGNYVKVVQRLPVRLRLRQGADRDHRLRPGVSVVPKVWVK